MKINIAFDDAYDCLDNVLVYLTLWFGREFELMFSQSWGFVYNYNPLIQSFAEALEPNRGDTLLLLEKYHGIRSYLYSEINDSLFPLIQEEIDAGYPVGIYIDGYWSPWNKKNYLKNHSDHFCLVTDIKIPEKEFICQDSQLALNGERLSFTDFLNGCTGIRTFRKSECHNSYTHWKEILLDSLSHYENNAADNQIFANMKKLSIDIKDKLDLKSEIKGYEFNYTQAPFFQKIYDISRGRRQFVKTLQYLAEKNRSPDMERLAESMKTAGDSWGAVFGMLVKACYSDNANPIIQRVSEKISCSADFEKQVTETIRELIKQDDNRVMDNHKIQNTPEDRHGDCTHFQYINLYSHCNNKGLETTVSVNTIAELSNGGRYFLVEHMPENFQLKVGQMKFLFPEIKDRDNISCEGQVIPVPAGKYSKIMFLGCSEFGNHYDNLIIEYDDGNKEKIALELTSWLVSKANFGESIAFTGKGVVRDGKSVFTYPFNVNLFAKEKNLQYSGSVKSIALPYCPNIHIFAISFAY